MSYSQPANLATMVQPNNFIIQANIAIAWMGRTSPIAEGTPIAAAVNQLFQKMGAWVDWHFGPEPLLPVNLTDQGVLSPAAGPLDPENPPACLVERMARALQIWGMPVDGAPALAGRDLENFVLEPSRVNIPDAILTHNYPAILRYVAVAIPLTMVTGELAVAYCLKSLWTFPPAPE